MSSRTLLQWFTPHVSQQDFFVEPNFDLAQFFYTAETARLLVNALNDYSSPCCFCTPRLAWEWKQRGREVRLLDYDVRFSVLPGFRHFDVLKPEPINELFDVVIFDPIFVPAGVLVRAVRAVMAGSPMADLYMTFPIDREEELLRAFATLSLKPVDFPLTCCNIKPEYQSLFRLYGSRSDLQFTNQPRTGED